MPGDTGIYCTTAAVQAKAGSRCSATSNVEGWINTADLEAEGVINAFCGKVFATTPAAFAALPAAAKYLLSAAASSYVASMVIQYDMSGMPAREAETRLDFLRDNFWTCIKQLQDRANFVYTGV